MSKGVGGLAIGRIDRNAHFGVLLRIHDCSDGDTEVGDWAPEIYISPSKH